MSSASIASEITKACKALSGFEYFSLHLRASEVRLHSLILLHDIDESLRLFGNAQCIFYFICNYGLYPGFFI